MAIECDDPRMDDAPWSHSRPWHPDGINILYFDGAVLFQDVVLWSSSTCSGITWWRTIADKTRVGED